MDQKQPRALFKTITSRPLFQRHRGVTYAPRAGASVELTDPGLL